MKRFLASLLLCSTLIGVASAKDRRRAPSPEPPAAEPPAAELPASGLCQAAVDEGFFMAEDGTLFRQLDFRNTFVMPFTTLPYIERFIDAFADVGVQLVVPLVPSRALGLPDLLKGSPEAEAFPHDRVADHYAGALSWLAVHGALPVDLLKVSLDPSRGEPFFHRYDHHWTVEGARDAALATAAVIRASPAGASLPKLEHATTLVGEEVELASLASRVDALCGPMMPESRFPIYKTAPVNPPSLGLLDAPEPPQVVVAGSSFMRERFNFGGFLAEALSADVLTSQVGGGRALAGLHAYLLSDDYRAAPPKVLVWELVLSFMVMQPDSDESAAFMNPAIYRELTAAVFGDCEGEALLEAELMASEGTQLLRLPPELKVHGPAHYLSLTFPQGGVEEPRIITRYHSGEVDRHAFNDYSRVDRSGRFMLALDPRFEGPAAAVNVRLPEGVSAPVIARVCAAP